MTSDHDPLGGFEQRLLSELKSVVAERKAEQSGPARVRTPLWRRPRVVSAASAGALAIGATVGVPLLGGQSTTPSASAAFDLRTNDDGTITVTIHEFNDAAGLEQQLADHGVSADVTYVAYGKRCQDGRYEPASDQPAVEVRYELDGDILVTLRPSDLDTGETLVLTNDQLDRVPAEPGQGADIYVIEPVTAVAAVGEVQPCALEDNPSEPPIGEAGSG